MSVDLPAEGFSLHPRLEADTHHVLDLALSRVLLADDATYPWVILVPMLPEIREIHDLSVARQHLLVDESSRVASSMQRLFEADKMNVAALGNMVPQLHLHHVARFEGDAAWPAPIWGAAPARPYDETSLQRRLDILRGALR